MSPRFTAGAAALLAFALFEAGCANTRVAPLTGANTLDDDEQRLWLRSAEEEARLDQSRFRANLPEAEAYLDGMIRRLNPATLPRGRAYRARILIDPTLNAFAYPDGTVYVHTGLLVGLDNEAQLAVILAHELTHTTHRHGLRGLRKNRNASAFLASFTVGTAGLGALLGGVGTLASVSGYSQDLEREADQGGFQLMLAAGYDPREAPRAFSVLRDDTRRDQAKEPYFFGSHPRLTERIASFESLLAALPAERRHGRTEPATYAAALLPAFRLNAEAALHAGDFDKVTASTARIMAVQPRDPQARLLLAEARRRRAKDDDLKTARSSLEALTRDSPDLAAAWRELGLVLLKLSDRPAAISSFQRYLELAPAASDRAYIETFLKP